MIKLLKLSLTLTFLLTIYTKSEAAIHTTTLDEIKVLVIQKSNGKQRKIKKHQTFKVGESIVFQTKKDKTNQKGVITGFEENQIVVIDKTGNTQKITVDDLSSIRRKYTVLSFLYLWLYLGFLSFFIIIIGFISLLLNPPVGVPFPIGPEVLSISLLLSLLTGLLGHIGFRKFRLFRLNSKWNAEIQKVNE